MGKILEAFKKTPEVKNDWLADLFKPVPATKDVPKAVAPTANPTVPKLTRRACPKCAGQGRLGHYSHVSGGVCYACNGNGWKTVLK